MNFCLAISQAEIDKEYIVKKVLEKGYLYPTYVSKDYKNESHKGNALIIHNDGKKLYAVPEALRDGWKNVFDFLIKPARFEFSPTENGFASRDDFLKGLVMHHVGVDNKGNTLIDIGTTDWFFSSLRINVGKSVRLVDEGNCVVVYRF